MMIFRLRCSLAHNVRLIKDHPLLSHYIHENGLNIFGLGYTQTMQVTLETISYIPASCNRFVLKMAGCSSCPIS